MKSLKLNKINRSQLNDEQMIKLKGGDSVGVCGCGCCYAGQPGGSSLNANGSENANHGYYSPGCENVFFPRP